MTIKIWAVSDGSCLKTFEGHTAGVSRASFLTRGAQFVSCGFDGLVKLWTIKSNECIATYDQHDEKIWALAIGRKSEMLASGGEDAVINLWPDSTALDKEEIFQKEADAILRGQELENAVTDADYPKAIQLAFELRRPHKLFELFSQLCREMEVSCDKPGEEKKVLNGGGVPDLNERLAEDWILSPPPPGPDQAERWKCPATSQVTKKKVLNGGGVPDLNERLAEDWILL
ncbi:hypothetical protein KSP40_PGU015282 [Platanthera guangdongensis]|uniref:U3 small nucleolar RNA-associated protein 13 C-terminal domain-containing protein n=1 Tax=Platanthera guangdongensis TaxID=2320717 RepID=A0ABR2LV69_9ASPA